MKRIGILTFHRAHNAGAMLQAFALQKYISSIGDFKAELVDYRNKQIESQYYPDLSVKYSVKYILKYIIYHKDTVLRNKRRKRYNAFLKQNLVVSTKQYDSETMKGEGNHQYGLKGKSNASWKTDEKITCNYVGAYHGAGARADRGVCGRTENYLC